MMSSLKEMTSRLSGLNRKREKGQGQGPGGGPSTAAGGPRGDQASEAKVPDENSPGEPGDTVRQNSHVPGVPAEEREKGAERLLAERDAENGPDPGKEMEVQPQEAQRAPDKATP